MNDVTQLLEQINEGDTRTRHRRPQTINRGIPRALNTICMKCLETDPNRRYFNAREPADDLRRYLDGEA